MKFYMLISLFLFTGVCNAINDSNEAVSEHYNASDALFTPQDQRTAAIAYYEIKYHEALKRPVIDEAEVAHYRDLYYQALAAEPHDTHPDTDADVNDSENIWSHGTHSESLQEKTSTSKPKQPKDAGGCCAIQ